MTVLEGVTSEKGVFSQIQASSLVLRRKIPLNFHPRYRQSPKEILNRGSWQTRVFRKIPGTLPPPKATGSGKRGDETPIFT